jgi:predicted nuclease with TOPRIM domain
MAELDKVPQTQSVEIAVVKLSEELLNPIVELNQKSNMLINDFGQIHIRKKEITEELVRLDEILEKAEDEFKMTQVQLRELIDDLDELYPQGRLNLQEGTIQYQPGAPTRKEQAAQQQAQNQQNAQSQSSQFKVVKD